MNYYANSSPNDYWNYLAHYGVKGMRWKNKRNRPGFREENDAIRNPLKNPYNTYNGSYLNNRRAQAYRLSNNDIFGENKRLGPSFNKLHHNPRSSQEIVDDKTFKNTYKMRQLKAAAKNRNPAVKDNATEDGHRVVRPPQSYLNDKKHKRAHDKPYGHK